MNTLEEIKSKLDVVEVLSEYLALKPAGGNWRALCPFHHEKTPSFMISPEKQIWHCFGCQKGGDIFTFVMEMEGLTFGEALKQLAHKAGVTLKKEDYRESSKRNNLIDVLSAAKEYYQRQMFKNEVIKNYLKSRGLDEKTVREWQIGYSPDSFDDLLINLRQKGYSDEDIFLSGLSQKKEGSTRYYNRFRDRIMFPINDISGLTVGFTARVNPRSSRPEMEKMGKYINSPQTAVYDKSRILFGLDKARQAIKSQDLAIVVEGQMDVISCQARGFKNTVASSGTALTYNQVKLLKRYSNNLALAFDADQAGQIAADRGIVEALAQEMNVKVIIIPQGKDPDECVRQDPELWQQAVLEAQPVLEYYFNKITSGVDLSDVSQKRIVVPKMLDLIAKVKNSIEADHWLKKLAAKTNTEEAVLRENLANIRKNIKEVKPRFDPVYQPILELSRDQKMAELLLSLLLKEPQFLEYTVNNLLPDYLPTASLRQFYNQLIIYYNTNQSLDYQGLRANFLNQAEALIDLLDTLSLLADKDFATAEALTIKAEIIKLVVGLKHEYYKKEMNQLEADLAQAETEVDQEKARQLLEKLKELSGKIKDLNF